MEKIHFLVMAPYKGLDEIVLDLLSAQEDVEVDCYVAHDEDAVDLLGSLDLSVYDAVISRGGTATLLSEHTNLPIYDVGFSSLDALRAVRLAQNFEMPIAVIGYEAITKTMHMICEAMQWEYPIVTIENADRTGEELRTLRGNGYPVVVCDAVAVDIASSMGMNTVLVTTGYESVESTLAQAIRLCRSYLRSRDELSHLMVSFTNNRVSCTVFHLDGRIVMSSLELQDPHQIYPYIREHWKDLSAEESPEFQRSWRGGILSFRIQRAVLRKEEYLYLYASYTERPVFRKIDAIRQISGSAAEKLDFSYYNSVHHTTSTREQIERYGRALTPVIITGEQGTGKDQAAYFIHSKSAYHTSVYYQIDCETATDRNWKYLLSHHESPLMHNKHTLYFRHVDSLSPAVFQRLMSQIIDTNMANRNRLIFSVVTGEKNSALQAEIMRMMRSLKCLVLRLPSLRERQDDIPYLCTLYINRLNLKLGKQIIGFDARALRAMKSFVWESNLDQFQRITESLMLVTNTSYISYEDTMRQLSQESSLWTSPGAGGYQFNLDQTLADINYDIARHVLREENGNHSRTAERLGISRSTLWRMLKR